MEAVLVHLNWVGTPGLETFLDTSRHHIVSEVYLRYVSMYRHFCPSCISTIQYLTRRYSSRTEGYVK